MSEIRITVEKRRVDDPEDPWSWILCIDGIPARNFGYAASAKGEALFLIAVLRQFGHNAFLQE